VTASSPDPFLCFGLAARFNVDAQQLDARHRELSRALHPDRYVGAPAGERRRALNAAMDVNHAYRQLRQPLGRAEALLRLLGVPSTELETRKLDQQYLTDVLEQREELAEARAARDIVRVRELAGKVRAAQAQVLSELSLLLDQGVLATYLAHNAQPATASAAHAGTSNGAVATPTDVRVSHPEEVDQALSAVARMRYLGRFLDEVATFEDEIG
jgi:molecular chaperone HscB